MELMLVIAILGVLAALISGNFITSLKKGRDARRKADMEQIQRALEMYYEDKRAYPTPAAAPGFPFGSAFSDPVSTKIYMQKVPNDPIGVNYGYTSDGTYYRMYSCLENDQQILPYQSQNYSGVSGFTCTKNCQYPSGTTVTCVWGISSSNNVP